MLQKGNSVMIYKLCKPKPCPDINKSHSSTANLQVNHELTDILYILILRCFFYVELRLPFVFISMNHIFIYLVTTLHFFQSIITIVEFFFTQSACFVFFPRAECYH